MRTRTQRLVTGMVSVLVACSSGSGSSNPAGGAAAAQQTGGSADSAGNAGDNAAGAGGSSANANECGVAGWTAVRVSWDQLRRPMHEGEGVVLCRPDDWRLVTTGTVTLGVDNAMIQVFAYTNTEHSFALQYVADSLSAHCTSSGYEREIFALDGWPAVLERYTEPAPICGACEGTPGFTQLARITMSIAAGSDTLVFEAQGDAAQIAWYEPAIRMLQSVSVSNGETPMNTDAELTELSATMLEGCP